MLQSVRGDEGALPNKGTSTGVKDTYGADLGQDATNSKPMSGTQSDPMMQEKTKDALI